MYIDIYINITLYILLKLTLMIKNIIYNTSKYLST